MSKIKKFFGAGDRQDDEVMYNSPPRKNADESSLQENDSTPGPEPRTEYGSTSAVGATDESKTQTRTEPTPPSLKDSIPEDTRQTSAAATETSPTKSDDYKDSKDSKDSKSKGLLSKILPSKSDKKSEESKVSNEDKTAETGAVAGTATNLRTDGGESSITESRAVDSEATKPTAAGSTTSGSNWERDTAIAGAGTVGAAGVGTAAYEYNARQSDQQDSNLQQARPRQDTRDDVSRATYTERSYALNPATGSDPSDSHFGRDAAITGAGAGIVGTGAYAATRGNEDITPSTRAQDIQRPEQVDSASRFAPHVPGEFPTEDGRDPHDARSGATSAAVGNTAALGTGGAAYASRRDDGFASRDQSMPHYYGRPEPEPAASPPPAQSEYPKPVEQEHHYGRDAALAGAGAAVIGGGAYGTSRLEDQRTTAPAATSTTSRTAGTSAAQSEYPRPVEQEHHYGRDTALAGASAAVVGGGAYETSRLDDPRATAPAATSTTTTATDTTATSTTSKPTEESHLGRDTAVMGGAGATGAAGIAATEAWKDQDTGPASKTIGPYESNVKNVLDPRVKPDSSKQKEKEPMTSGPHKSDMANILDPRVKDSSPAVAKEENDDRDTGHDGAVIAATTAMAGGGTYVATADDDQASPSDNRVSTDTSGHHHLHKKSEERQGEKKPGFISKLLHRDKNKKENEDTSGTSEEFAGAGAAREMEGQSDNTTGLPVGDDGLITLVKERSHPDAPHMTITEHEGQLRELNREE